MRCFFITIGRGHCGDGSGDDRAAVDVAPHAQTTVLGVCRVSTLAVGYDDNCVGVCGGDDDDDEKKIVTERDIDEAVRQMQMENGGMDGREHDDLENEGISRQHIRRVLERKFEKDCFHSPFRLSAPRKPKSNKIFRESSISSIPSLPLRANASSPLKISSTRPTNS